MTPLALTLLCASASSFAGAFFGQRVRVPATWMAHAERLALRAAAIALELERKRHRAELERVLELDGCESAAGCGNRKSVTAVRGGVAC
jgi:hypothetical protein